MSDLISLAKKGVYHALSLGVDQVEVYAGKGNQVKLEVEKAHPVSADILDTGGAVVRAYKGKALGLVYTTRIEELTEAVEKAYHIARASPEDPYFKSLPEPGAYHQVAGLYDNALASSPVSELVDMFMRAVDTAASKQLTALTGRLTRTVAEIVILNSLGVEVQSSHTSITGGISAKTERDGDVALGQVPILGRSLKEFIPEEVGEDVAEKTNSHLGAKKVLSGTMDIILDYRTALDSVNSVLGFGVSGLNVALGTSFLLDKMGQAIGYPKLSVIDDPFISGGLGSRAFDDEGAPTTRLTLLENGVLKTYCTDSYSASRLGIPNTGNASRASAASKPTPSLTNLQVRSGDWDIDELLSETKKGIVIEDSELGVAGTSTNISSMANNGFYVENGEILHPIKNTMVGLTVLDFFTNIDAITKQTLAEAGSSCPTIRISKVNVAGGL